MPITGIRANVYPQARRKLLGSAAGCQEAAAFEVLELLELLDPLELLELLEVLEEPGDDLDESEPEPEDELLEEELDEEESDEEVPDDEFPEERESVR